MEWHRENSKMGWNEVEVLGWNEVYYLKVQNMAEHQLPKLAWNIGCKIQELITEESSHLVGCWEIRNGLNDGDSKYIGAIKWCNEVSNQ